MGLGVSTVGVLARVIGLLQRVSRATVCVGGREIAAIDRGLLVLVGVQKDDTEARATRLLERLLGYRVFADADGRMNRSVRDVQGGLLLVPQFTLAADTAKGTRAGFSTAAEPGRARELFEALVSQAKALWPQTQSGAFGADPAPAPPTRGAASGRVHGSPPSSRTWSPEAHAGEVAASMTRSATSATPMATTIVTTANAGWVKG